MLGIGLCGCQRLTTLNFAVRSKHVSSACPRGTVPGLRCACHHIQPIRFEPDSREISEPFDHSSIARLPDHRPARPLTTRETLAHTYLVVRLRAGRGRWFTDVHGGKQVVHARSARVTRSGRMVDLRTLQRGARHDRLCHERRPSLRHFHSRETFPVRCYCVGDQRTGVGPRWG